MLAANPQIPTAEVGKGSGVSGGCRVYHAEILRSGEPSEMHSLHFDAQHVAAHLLVDLENPRIGPLGRQGCQRWATPASRIDIECIGRLKVIRVGAAARYAVDDYAPDPGRHRWR